MRRIMRFVLALSASSAALGAGQAMAAASICDDDAGNLVQNCGFEGGSYTYFSVSEGGYISVPNDWTALPGYSGAFIDGAATHSGAIDTIYPHSGQYFLTLGNLPPASGVSQTITDTAGTSYDLSLYIGVTQGHCLAGGAPLPYCSASVLFGPSGDQSELLSLQSDPSGDFPTGNDVWTYYGHIKVTGSGSDILTLAAFDDSGYVNFDDVEINGLPEPGSLALLGSALSGLGFISFKRKGRSKLG